MTEPFGVTFILEWSPTTDPLASPVWVDITEDFISIDTQRGKSSILSQFEAGRATIRVGNAHRKYDPSNTSSPYSPNVKPLKRIRLRVTHGVTTYAVFDGFIERYDIKFKGVGDAEVVFQCVDLFKILALKQLEVPYVMEVLKDNPVAYYRFSETSSSQAAADSSGNGHNGTYLGSPTMSQSDPITDDIDGAVLFDGVDDQVQLPIAAMLDTANGLTFEAWLKKSAAPATDKTVVGQTGPNTRFTTFVDTAGKARIHITVAAGTFVSISTSGVANAAFHTITGVLDADEATARLYVDGTQEATDTTAIAPTNSGLVPALFIGGRDPNPPSTFIAGTIDEVALFNTALSATRVTAHWDARNGWSGDLSGTRIGRVLDWIGLSTADRDLDSGNTTLVSAGDIAGQSALDHIQRVVESEQGWFFISKDGKATFIERHAFFKDPYSTSQATFGDDGAELAYEEIVPSLDDDEIWNEVVVSRRDGATARATDEDSQDSYGRRTLSRSGQLMNSDSEANDAAHALLNRYKQPVLRFPSLVLNPVADRTNLFPQILGRELLDRITIKRRPPGGGPTMSQDVHIQGISHRMTASPDFSWETRFDVFPVEPNLPMLVGVPGRSEAGVTTFVGY